MNNLFEEKRTLFLLLLSLVFLGLLTVYLFFLQPLSAELRSTKSANVSLEDDIAVLEAMKDPDTRKDIDTLLLQKKIPLDPELEKLLLTFQEIEQTSGSRIDAVEFSYDGNDPEFDFSDEEKDAEGNQENETKANTEDDEKDDPKEDINKPEKLHLVTAELTVLSPDHEHFMKFIKEVEALERVTRVDQLELFQPTEEDLDFQEKADQSVEFIMTVTTFYYK